MFSLVIKVNQGDYVPKERSRVSVRLCEGQQSQRRPTPALSSALPALATLSAASTALRAPQLCITSPARLSHSSHTLVAPAFLFLNGTDLGCLRAFEQAQSLCLPPPSCPRPASAWLFSFIQVSNQALSPQGTPSLPQNQLLQTTTPFPSSTHHCFRVFLIHVHGCLKGSHFIHVCPLAPLEFSSQGKDRAHSCISWLGPVAQWRGPPQRQLTRKGSDTSESHRPCVAFLAGGG